MSGTKRYTPPATFETLHLDPPAGSGVVPAVYAAGDLRLLDHDVPRVAVVGSRDASEDGLRRARKLGALLAKAGVVVVSGLAAGVDRAAHEGALSEGGRTIAVIGTPLDRAYPAANAELQERVWREHLLISQFPSGARVHRGQFPMRNRTMAYLSHASVVVEAGDSSGTLSQAAETLRLARSLFLMRNLTERDDLDWPSRFLANGAQILDTADVVIESARSVATVQGL